MHLTLAIYKQFKRQKDYIHKWQRKVGKCKLSCRHDPWHFSQALRLRLIWEHLLQKSFLFKWSVSVVVGIRIMAFKRTVLPSIIVFLFQILSACLSLELESNNPVFESLKVLNITEKVHNNEVYNEIRFMVHGRNIYSQMDISTSNLAAKRHSLCGKDLTNYNVSEIRTQGTWGMYVLSYPKSNKENVYFCLPRVTREIVVPSISESFHQGESIFVNSGSLPANSSNVIQPNAL